MPTQPEQGPIAVRSHRFAFLLVLGCVAFATYLPRAMQRTAWQPDEIRIAAVSREMAEFGHPLVPYLNGEVYSEKPPLLNWMIRAAHGATDNWFVAGHLVVLLFVALGTISVAGIALQLGSERAVAALAGLIFLTMWTVSERAVQIIFDPVLTGFVLLSTWCWLVRAGRTSRRTWLWIGVAAACAGASLTKGPVALLHIGLSIGALHAIQFGFSWRDAAALGGVLAVGVIAPLLWVFAAALQVGGWFWDQMVWNQTAHRLAGDPPHAEAWYGYLKILGAEYLPALLLAPLALGAAWAVRGDAKRARPFKAVSVWFGLGLIVFSAISAKRAGYVLPLAAPVALWLAMGLAEAQRQAQDRAPGSLACVLMGVLAKAIAAAGVAFVIVAALPQAWVGSRLMDAMSAPASAWGVEIRLALVVVGVLWLVVAWQALGHARAGRVVAGGLWTTGALCLLIAIFGSAATRSVEPYNSPELFLQRAVARVPQGETLYLLDNPMHGRVALFAGGESYPVLPKEDLDAKSSGVGDLWLLADGDRWEEVSLSVRQRALVELEGWVRRRDIYLVHFPRAR